MFRLGIDFPEEFDVELKDSIQGQVDLSAQEAFDRGDLWFAVTVHVMPEKVKIFTRSFEDKPDVDELFEFAGDLPVNLYDLGSVPKLMH